MDLRRLDTTIRVWVVLAFAAGIALIIVGDGYVQTITGVVLVILSLLSIMAVIRNALVEDTSP